MPARPPPPPRPAKINLPLATHFVERKALMDEILQAVAPRQGVSGPRTAVISALHGMGGIGKTVLAREAARRLNCPGGTAEVNLRGWDSKEPMEEAEALRALSRRLGDPAPENTTADGLRTHWRRITSGRQCLVILDNLSDASLIEPLRPTDGITLVTTRTRGLIRGVPGIDVGVMQPPEAAELARQNCPGLSEADALRLAKATGYLPLAIEIAAVRLNDTGESVAALETRLTDPALAASVLTGGTPDEDVLLRILQWSLAGLPPERVAQWQALSVAPGDFGLWTVQALWQTEDPVEGLRALVRRNLVTRLEGQGRWRLHDILRRFALAALQANPDREQMLWQHLGSATWQRLNEIHARFHSGGGTMVHALSELDSELPLLRAIYGWSAKNRKNKVASINIKQLPLFTELLTLRLPNNENAGWLRASFLENKRNGEPADAAKAAGNLGLIYRRMERPQRAIALTVRSSQIFKSAGDQHGHVGSQAALGLICNDSGNFPEAERIFLHCLEQFEILDFDDEHSKNRRIAQCLGNLGIVYKNWGKSDASKCKYLHCIKIFEQIEDWRGVAINRESLAGLYTAFPNLGAPLDEYRKAIALAEKIQMPEVERSRQALAEAEARLAESSSLDTE